LEYDENLENFIFSYRFNRFSVENCVERTILLKYLTIYLDTDLKIILLDHKNNYAGNSNIMSNVARNFDILVIWTSYIIILIVH